MHKNKLTLLWRKSKKIQMSDFMCVFKFSCCLSSSVLENDTNPYNLTDFTWISWAHWSKVSSVPWNLNLDRHHKQLVTDGDRQGASCGLTLWPKQRFVRFKFKSDTYKCPAPVLQRKMTVLRMCLHTFVEGQRGVKGSQRARLSCKNSNQVLCACRKTHSWLWGSEVHKTAVRSAI